MKRADFLRKIRRNGKMVALRAWLIPTLALVACTPEHILTPPGDIVSSVRPVQTAPVVANTAPPAGNADIATYPMVANAVLDRGTKIGPATPSSQIGRPSIERPKQEQKKGLGLAALSNLYSMPALSNPKPTNVSQCQRQLRRLGVRYETPPPVNGPGKCGIAHPVKVKQLSGGINVVPAAVLNCPMALAFAKWVKAELAPAARKRYLAGIQNIHQMSAYSCRTMNSKRGAPLSEHATGNAIDIGKIKLNSGKEIVVKRPGFFAFREKSLLHNVRAESCKYFTTVLGPGSDVNHKDHFHFDLRQRSSGYRHCDL